MSSQQAALVEPLACVINGQDRVGINSGDMVVILGAGPIGVLHVKLARHRGAKRIIVSQRSAYRSQAALSAGADVAINPTTENLVARVKEETGGAGADVVICTMGNPELAEQALHLARVRGRVSLFGGFLKDSKPETDLNIIHYKELSVVGAFGLSRKDYHEALGLIENGQIEVASMITHIFPLSDIEKAFAAAESGARLKVAVIP